MMEPMAVATPEGVAGSETVARPSAETEPGAPCVIFLANEKVVDTEEPNASNKFAPSYYDSRAGEHKKITVGRTERSDVFLKTKLKGFSGKALEVRLVQPGAEPRYEIQVCNIGKYEISLYEGMAPSRIIKQTESFQLVDGAIISIGNGKLLLKAKIDLDFDVDFKETIFTVAIDLDTRNTVSVTRLSNECND